MRKPEGDGTRESSALDLGAYLRRIGYENGLSPTRATLDALHLAHATHIPFENLDIHLRRPIRLDLASLQAKLVGAGRGGYCFEQNLLFAAVLEAIGFSVTRLAARVRLGGTAVRPRTHMTLRVDVEGQRLVADVGFGADGLLLPVPLDAALPSRQFAWSYRVVEDGGLRRLQSCSRGAWSDLYAFTLEPQELADYEMASWYTSTHPQSRFVQTATAQRLAPDLRRTLRGHEYAEDRGAGPTIRTIAGDDEVLAVLAEEFGLRFPAGTRFRPPRTS